METKGKILLVDDESLNLEIYSELLVNYGYEVYTASNSQETFNQLEKNQPDLILLDIVLRSESGLDILEKIKTENNYPYIYIVMITGALTSSDDQALGLEKGADGYLLRAIENRELLARIDAFMRHKRSLDKIRKNRTQLLRIIEKSPDAILVVDKKGTVSFANTAAEHMFKLTLDQLMSYVFGFPIVKGEHTEINILRQDDSKLIGEMRTVDINWEDKETFLTSIRDITRHKEIEKDLKKALLKAEENDKLKSAFLANMSHEIRTPMNGLIGFSERLKKDNLSDEQKNRYIDIVQNSAKSLLNLIDDIINISKIEAGQLTIIKEPCLPGKLLNEVHDTFNEIKIQKNKSHIQIVKKIPQAQEFVEFITDSNRIKQVLINLIGNALKFSDKGTIEFGYEIVNKRIRFFVKDDGIGIAPKDLDNIFNRFQQASISDDRVYEGTGLGLSISKGIIELLGGEIKVASTLRKGSTFEFFLPYKQLDKKQNIDVEENEINFDKFNGKSILIAEDDLISQDLYQETFKEFPAKMLYAYNGKEAVDIIAEKPDIDLILMDIRMPIMDGIEATKRILKQNPKIKIIAQTAHAMTNDKMKFLQLGFVDYIPKPIDIDELFKRIAKWISQ
jgi:signal transduction histidine kinase